MWFEVDRIAMRHVFEDVEELDQIPFTYRTWPTPWDRWMHPAAQSDPRWRRAWEHVVALVRRGQSSSSPRRSVLAR